MIEKLRSFSGNQKWIGILFTLLILSFPFGSFFLSFSIGFMTVYPFLVLLVVMTFLAFLAPRKKTEGIIKYYLFFVILFFAYALAFLPFVEGRSDAVIDLRSIAMMLMTTWVFISTYLLFGFDKWRQIILFCFKLIFFLVIAFALLEMVTGWHIAGEFTGKIVSRGIPDHMLYMPVFLWDNPNSLMVYMILIGCAILILEPFSGKKDYLALVVLVIPLVFAVVLEARSAQVAIGLITLLYYGNRALENSVFKNKLTVIYILFVTGATAYALFTQDIFKEIPASKIRRISYAAPLNPAPVAEFSVPEAPGTSQHKNSLANNPVGERNSNQERTALVKNGLDFVRESHLLGVGPGQYRYRHNQGQVNHYAFGNNGAHFWLIELISQYGVLIFAMYLGALCWIFYGILRYFRQSRETAVGLLIGLIALTIASVLPSAFLILDINWIFTVILIVVAGESLQKKPLPEDD